MLFIDEFLQLILVIDKCVLIRRFWRTGLKTGHASRRVHKTNFMWNVTSQMILRSVSAEFKLVLNSILNIIFTLKDIVDLFLCN